MNVEDWKVIEDVPQRDWYMRSHPTMSDKNKSKEREYLHLWGN